ncbi:phasin family protein [Bradyrhizobium liaoningense]|uniref:phasin family protein n=1 Tax=Bradyrhizobium liaoningense TaxID=43992 RepID=UPI002011697D|nr:phasin family protein [Bradyrhizobium liaoningense]
MDKPRSRQPADVARARRRSLVELTAAASRTIDEGLLERPPNPIALSRDDGPQVEQAEKTLAQKTPAQKAHAQKTHAQKALAQTAVPAAVNGSVAMPPPAKVESRAAQIQNSSSTTDLALEIAKDMQARALETMKAGVHAALDYARDPASPESKLLEGAAAECHAVVLELMKVNAGATLQYTRELGRARTLSELIELSSTHARKQCELVLQQAELLKSLTLNATRSGTE